MFRYYRPVWVWGHRVKFSPSVRERGEGRVVTDKYHIPATLDNNSPQTPWIGHLPAIIFLPRQYHFIKSPSQQNVPKEQIFWWIDPLGAPACSYVDPGTSDKTSTKPFIKRLFSHKVEPKTTWNQYPGNTLTTRPPNKRQGAKIAHFFNTKTPPPFKA